MLFRSAQGYDIAITPDGPRGPKYELGSGLVYLAQKAALPILPCHARFHGALRLKTWDRFAIPLPFARLDVTIGPAMQVPSDATDFEVERKKIESVLRTEAD